MKVEKRNYYFTKILECLLENELVTTKDIAEQVKISEKTTRTKISEINEYLEDNQLGIILKKPRIGNWLEVDEAQRGRIRQIIYNNDELLTIQDEDERMYDVLSYIFKHRKKEIITTMKLANHLYLSTPTILKILKDCEKYLNEHHVKLKNTRNDGIIIIFNESNYRNVLKRIIMRSSQTKAIEKNIMDILPGIHIDAVKKIMLDVENEWKFEFSDESFYEILVYYCMAIHRCNKGTFKIDTKDYKTLEQYHEYTFAKAIFEKIEKAFKLKFSREEIHFLVIQILCSRFLGEEVDFENREILKRYDAKLIAFTNELIDMASQILSTDLQDDSVLRNSLLNHLRSTIFRMEYGKPSSNSLIYFIKKEYKHLFRQMWSTSVLFEKYFNFKITEDELGFICLYIQAALDRKEQQYKLLIISNQTNSTTQFMIQKIQKMYPEINEVKVTGSHDFDIKRYDDYRIIVSLVDLSIKDRRMLYITEFLNEDWIHDLAKKIKDLSLTSDMETTIFNPICHQLFDPDLIFKNLACKNKDELLKIMSKRMTKKGFVTQEFGNSVLDREQATTTEIGNGIALPHGNQFYVNEPKVAIAILDKPIVWDREEVDIVFLLAMRMISKEESKQAQAFYKEYVSLVESNEKLQKLKNMRTNLDLYRYLIR
ncbi:activator of the mannose operon (transcriptional antiterminator) [Breznakia sp. PF5-3]|uniref:BglG family transcription antiterminator n=1 Tax=unclassified Breznakia TaxID=2623764 RepID=UPI0024054A07|nr:MULTISPECIES: PTS sugar transporter subunit IIA [unclassified Breznakia]MDL2276019.1 PTS sugar transporter subunit IIA [Breznakia sp. OttesenSCG-928-G09]MDF9824338.1 activator of the mannose operon (transcriptional antiterminator) [Breznakia sp. PM6-1]MDF9835071.1 activator of the mannose operon (transcriptional antiterminator) [Breznakia sp. PF5-3]MDF9837758.1 activator of the mannose operon (transcriptional antiterminator) [Breznakia sp. PFB2-8]MDF9859637.1 activator of the mannose operon